MTTIYLLPCECGKKLPVEAPQAGQTVHCSCGESLEVPTIRGLAKLGQAKDTAPAATGPRWGQREGLLLLGAVIAVLALTAAGGLHLRKHQVADDFVIPEITFTDEDAERIRQAIDKLSPAQTWREWQHLRGGVQRGQSRAEAKREKLLLQRQAATEAYTPWIIVAYAIAVVGVIVVAAAFLFMSSARAAKGSRPAR
jgi:hypothetical protein